MIMNKRTTQNLFTEKDLKKIPKNTHPLIKEKIDVLVRLNFFEFIWIYYPEFNLNKEGNVNIEIIQFLRKYTKKRITDTFFAHIQDDLSYELINLVIVMKKGIYTKLNKILLETIQNRSFAFSFTDVQAQLYPKFYEYTETGTNHNDYKSYSRDKKRVINRNNEIAINNLELPIVHIHDSHLTRHKLIPSNNIHKKKLDESVTIKRVVTESKFFKPKNVSSEYNQLGSLPIVTEEPQTNSVNTVEPVTLPTQQYVKNNDIVKLEGLTVNGIKIETVSGKAEDLFELLNKLKG